MSCVTADEIISLVCKSYGINRVQLPERGKGQGQRKSFPEVFEARAVITKLVLLHTEATLLDIVRAIGLYVHTKTGEQLTLHIERYDGLLSKDPLRQAQMRWLEGAISDIHEARHAAAEGKQPAAVAKGRGPLKKSPPTPVREGTLTPQWWYANDQWARRHLKVLTE